MDIQDIKKKYERKLMKKANVVGVMTAFKVTHGTKTNKLSIVCMVEKKVHTMKLKDKDIIPKIIDGISTDVIEVGEVKALGFVNDLFNKKLDEVDRKTRLRPCPMGTSGGHSKISIGTNGEILLIDDEYCIGTSNHVATNSNNAQIGEPYLQPSPYDGGSHPLDTIGYLRKYVPINFVGMPSDCSVAKFITQTCNIFAKILGRKTRLNAVYEDNLTNSVDAAAVIVIDDKDVLSEILDVGIPKGTMEAATDMSVHKSGRTTKCTSDGIVIATDATINVSYGMGKMALFTDQIVILKDGFSAGGDSGSLILDEDNFAVGKLFAGGNDITIANHIDNYLDALDATLVTCNVISSRHE